MQAANLYKINQQYKYYIKKVFINSIIYSFELILP